MLCGRATWKDGIPVYAKEGAPAFRDWLQAKGVENIKNVNAALKTGDALVLVLRRLEPGCTGRVNATFLKSPSH